MRAVLGEIKSYLDHSDHDLAVRRLLDLAHDTKEKGLVKEAIALSKLYQVEVQAQHPFSAQFSLSANNLLEKLSNVNIQPNHPETLVVADQITKTYGSGFFSLMPVSLEIQTGNVLGIVGENGNGKTTLLRCLAGQLAINSGSISYKDIKTLDYFDIKSYVTFIPQRIPKWYGRLKDNLHFSASIAGIIGEENELMVDFILERLRLTRFADLTWNQISSGYRTRFEIARVLLQKPRLLILDEPLANLDINAQQTILTDLQFMTKSANHSMAVLLSSQQLHEVEKIADNVLFIKNGACINQSKNSPIVINEFTVEIETKAERDAIVALLNNEVDIKYNGGYYTIISKSMEPAVIMKALFNAGIEVSYFRDITTSTKRFF